MLIAGIIGYGILGLRGHYFAICTLALGIAAGEIAGGVEIIGAGQGMTVPVWPKGFGSNELSSQFLYYLSLPSSLILALIFVAEIFCISSGKTTSSILYPTPLP